MGDLRLALRTLGKSPAFTIVAILSLALGTGANTAIFSLIDAVMLRLLPVAHPEQLVFVNTRAVEMGGVRIMESISGVSLEYLAQHANSISGIAGDQADRRIAVAVNGQAERAIGHFVSSAYYSTLGVQPLLGRVLNATDTGPGARLAVLGYGYWQRRFGGDAGVLGRQISINGVPFNVAGVTPREFYGLSADHPADVTVPFDTLAQVSEGRVSSKVPKPDVEAGDVVARLKDGVSATAAAAELTGLLRQAISATLGDDHRFQSLSKLTVELTPAGQGLSNVRRRFSEPLRVLMAVVILVMLIACANIATLLLAKSSGREREIAIRLSLGSTRWRLVRQLLTESLLLALGGGALGLVFAVWARSAIIRSAAVPEAAFSWSFHALAFTAGISFLNAILFGTMPALRATGVDLISALKKSGRGRIHTRFGLGRALIAGEVALSLTLLAVAGLFLGTFRNLDRIDLGYARKDALVITVDPHVAGYRGARAGEFYRQATDRVAALPGVRSVSQMNERLMSGNVTLSTVFVPGYAPKTGEDLHSLFAISNSVGPGFFRTAGMQLIAGRDFTERDNESATKVAVINETMARHFFGTSDAVGKQFSGGPGEPPIEIAGVVADLKYFDLRESRRDVMFTPTRQYAPSGQTTLLVRTAVPPASIVADIRATIRSIDPAVPVFDITTIDQQVEASLVVQKLLALLSTFFGALAVILAAIGLYGVLSSSVAQRTGEIGVRMALGAQPGNVLRLILGETARLVFIGIGLGLGVALAGAYFVRDMLYGVTATNPASLLGAAAILTATALIAAFLPARRASRVDPMVALRHE